MMIMFSKNFRIFCVGVFLCLITHSYSEILYKSQWGQDKWIVEEVFKHKKDGYFVDLGATDGVGGNNTWVLEKYFNWKGICIEPNPKFFQFLQKRRPSSINVNECIDYTNHEVDFIPSEVVGGIIDEDTDNNYAIRGNRIQKAYEKQKVLKFYTKTLEQVLDENSAPQVIDYLSIDVEGCETRILKNFPFDKYTFLVMTIERPTLELNKILQNNGYVFVKNINQDTVYVHESIPNFNEIEKEPFKQLPKWGK